MTFDAHKPLQVSVGLVSLLLSACIAHAHQPHEARIHHLEQQMGQTLPDDTGESVALILRRADLHRRQMDWEAALMDYKQVAHKEPDNLAMMLGRAQLHLEQHQYSQALLWSSQLLHLHPAHALGGLQYARALAGTGKVDAASKEFDRAISQLEKPTPEHYIEQARFARAAGNNSDAVHRAIAILDRGADALGHPVSLHNSAYELELEAQLHEAALQRIKKILTRNDSLLNWRLQRGELLLKMGRPTEAVNEMLCLIDRIQQLPKTRRSSHAFQVMKQRSEDLLQQMSATKTNVEISKKTGTTAEWCRSRID